MFLKKSVCFEKYIPRLRSQEWKKIVGSKKCSPFLTNVFGFKKWYPCITEITKKMKQQRVKQKINKKETRKEKRTRKKPSIKKET
jgi:hypothetical protein